jgi:hypothetical protein
MRLSTHYLVKITPLRNHIDSLYPRHNHVEQESISQIMASSTPCSTPKNNKQLLFQRRAKEHASPDASQILYKPHASARVNEPLTNISYTHKPRREKRTKKKKKSKRFNRSTGAKEEGQTVD